MLSSDRGLKDPRSDESAEARGGFGVGLAAGLEHGGEPLAQKGCAALLTQLCDAGLRVSLETSGAMALESVDPRVVKVVDVKTPGSSWLKWSEKIRSSAACVSGSLS